MSSSKNMLLTCCLYLAATGNASSDSYTYSDKALESTLQQLRLLVDGASPRVLGCLFEITLPQSDSIGAEQKERYLRIGFADQSDQIFFVIMTWSEPLAKLLPETVVGKVLLIETRAAFDRVKDSTLPIARTSLFSRASAEISVAPLTAKAVQETQSYLKTKKWGDKPPGIDTLDIVSRNWGNVSIMDGTIDGSYYSVVAVRDESFAEKNVHRITHAFPGFIKQCITAIKSDKR